MKKRLQFIAVAIALLPLAFSCKKDSDGGGWGGSQPTEVVITLPTGGQLVLNGSNLRVEGTVTDNNILSSVALQVRHKGTGAVLHSTQVNTGNVTFYRYTFNWTVTGVTTSFVATIKVTGKDINGGEAFKEVDINMEP